MPVLDIAYWEKRAVAAEARLESDADLIARLRLQVDDVTARYIQAAGQRDTSWARLAEANAAFEAEQTEKWEMIGRLAEAEWLVKIMDNDDNMTREEFQKFTHRLMEFKREKS